MIRVTLFSFSGMDNSFEIAASDESFTEVAAAATKGHKCNICFFMSKNKSGLTRHMKLHSDCNGSSNREASRQTNIHICDVCGKALKSAYGLSQHKDSMHNKKFRFKCGICERGFNSLYNYRGHLASHDKVLREKCSKCPATFQYKTSLKDHIKGQHGDAHPFTCTEEDCHKTFASPRALHEHTLAIHEQRLFRCSTCNKTYKWRSSRNFHEKHAHKNY